MLHAGSKSRRPSFSAKNMAFQNLHTISVENSECKKVFASRKKNRAASEFELPICHLLKGFVLRPKWPQIWSGDLGQCAQGHLRHPKRLDMLTILPNFHDLSAFDNKYESRWDHLSLSPRKRQNWGCVTVSTGKIPTSWTSFQSWPRPNQDCRAKQVSRQICTLLIRYLAILSLNGIFGENKSKVMHFGRSVALLISTSFQFSFAL